METVQLTPIEDYLSGPTMAVFDFGKTNAKMLVFNENGATVAGCRTAPRWIEVNGRRVMDDHYLWTWMQAALRGAAVSYNTDRVMVSAHGCTFAAVEGDHLALPILDYEAPIPADIRQAFLKVKPDFAETGAPDLPNGFSYGIQVYWMALAEPEAFGAATAILPYAQFWIWRLTGKAVSEVSYLGCHSHLWAPYSQDFSSLVDTMNWRQKCHR
nr:hypothetical protein [Marinicella sp. W31]MDC2880250.1 hypothetical protein [Marinicella sp. W31]